MVLATHIGFLCKAGATVVVVVTSAAATVAIVGHGLACRGA